VRQLTYLDTRSLEWREVAEPVVDSAAAAIVEPLAVSTCDMDGIVIHGILRIRKPTAVGHEGVGRVVDVGDAVTSVRPGDLVLLPWKIACGYCRYCLRGHTAQCETVAPEAAYGWHRDPVWGGFLSDLVKVPYADAMLTTVPDGADPVALAGVGDNVTDGWRAVGPPLAARPGGTVLVAGGVAPGSIPLYAAGLAVALGAERTVFVSAAADHRSRAAQMGAEVVDPADVPFEELGDFDVTVDGSGDPATFVKVLERTARAGVCTSTSAVVYAFGPTPVDMYELYRKSVTLTTGWVHTHALWHEPIALISSGRFDPAPVTSALVSFDDVAEALCEPFTKVVAVR
jgi:alcohol dehydrogenase